jgi:hypothetical protein
MLYRIAASAKTAASAQWCAEDGFACSEGGSVRLCVLDVMLHGVLLLYLFSLVIGLICGIPAIVTLILPAFLLNIRNVHKLYKTKASG